MNAMTLVTSKNLIARDIKKFISDGGKEPGFADTEDISVFFIKQEFPFI